MCFDGVTWSKDFSSLRLILHQQEDVMLGLLVSSNLCEARMMPCLMLFFPL